MKKLALVFSLIFVAMSSVFAQEHHGDHKHGSPHGGVVKSAGDYHLELLVKEGKMTVYLLDGKEKSLSVANAKGNAILQTVDGKASNAVLINDKTAFSYNVDKSVKLNKAIISVVINGKTASASFDIKESAGHHDHH